MTHPVSPDPLQHQAAAGSAPAHAPAPVTVQAPFPPEEWDQLRTEDRMAGTYIVGLMLGIFSLGLVGYIVVCLWVA